MDYAGFAMLGSVAVALVLTGLPVFVVLIGITGLFAAFGLATGELSVEFLSALPPRLIGLLENDLLQALPLYALMGVLLDRLPLAERLFQAFSAAGGRNRAAPLMAALGLGALLAPMNGSVGASVSVLGRVVAPRLKTRGVASGDGIAAICVASTLGVVVPPSLVLILLGDAMLRAHTEALNATGLAGRVINTQDVFRGALAPAAILLMVSLGWMWWRGCRQEAVERETLSWRDGFTALATMVLVGGLLGAVAAGRLYAVEAAAAGASVLFVAALVSRRLNGEVLAETMAVTGALFALLVAATSFTLLFRAFGTDRVLAGWVAHLPGEGALAVLWILALLAVAAFVLDAFEIIFVLIPILMPPLLVRVHDAQWVAVLTLLALQASFLMPPFGYALLMARGIIASTPPNRVVGRAVLPFLLLQLAVVAVVLAWPPITHLLDDPIPAASTEPPMSDQDIQRRMEEMLRANDAD